MSTFLKRVQSNCHRYPERIAFEDDRRSMTYEELWNESGKVCSWLKAQKYSKEDFCLIVLPRSVESMASLLGVLRSGCAFCNLDAAFPKERIAFINNDLNAKCVIDQEEYQLIQEKSEACDGYVDPDPHDAAFAVYTSGSTGTPKGVLHEYGNVDLCLSLYPEQDDYPELHSSLTAPFYSVASVLLAINCMAVARTTHIVSELLLRDLRGMSQFLVDKKIRDTFLPPSYLRLYREPSPYLETILTGAERANGIYYEGGKPEIINYYSMSEAGFPLLIFKLDRKYEEAPVGVPVVPGIDLHLEDEEGNRIEGAGEGEICFTDRFVRGYINQPEKTAESFINGVFHTRDIARRDENGLYYIVGRADDMIKISGNRVEPGEVELVFKRISNVPLCCAKGFEDKNGAFICMYYQGEIDKSDAELRDELGKELPEYMIPTYFIKMDQIPLMSHGKIDRKKLPDPRKETVRPVYVAPTDEIERALCKTIEKVLNVEKVGINDSFLSLGGNSLAAIETVSASGIEGLSVLDLFKGQTVQGIAECYRQKTKQTDGLTDEQREAEARKKTWPLTSIQECTIRHQDCYPGSSMEAQAFLVSFPILAGSKRIQEAVCKLMRHFAVFGTIFEKDENGKHYQHYDESRIVYPEIEHMKPEQFKQLIDEPVKGFDLYNEPQARVRIIESGFKIHLIMVYSHLIFDASSLQLIAKNFGRIVKNQEPDVDTYYSYLAQQAQLQNTKEWHEAKAYFEGQYNKDEWCWNIPFDIEKEEDLVPVRHTIRKVPAEQMMKMEKRSHITRAIFLGAALSIVLAKLNNNSKVVFGSFFHGRTNRISQNAAGLVTTKIAVGVDVDKCGTLADLYETLTKKTHEGLIKSAYNWCDENIDPYKNEAIDLCLDTAQMLDTNTINVPGVEIKQLLMDNQKPVKPVLYGALEDPENSNCLVIVTKGMISDAMCDRFISYISKMYEVMLNTEDPKQINISDLQSLLD
ncbi:MAG: non-ribosomal peptide synthetase [Erysipelotrichaceae bacterium]|nr:non-ribosomal peptide synthetase [Erysipelotrichaceae bacterium]